MRWVSLFVLAFALAPSTALAWTDASVRSARARVSIDEHAHAHVVLDVTLRVDGGWLEGFELDGLDPDLVLDANDPVTLVRAAPADGETTATPSITAEAFAPSVEVHAGGRIALALRRRGAPRRGDYLVHVAYDTELAGRATTATAEGVTVRWTFPAWRYGLDSVEVALHAPHGAVALPIEDEEIGLVEAADETGALITLTRAHLARTREWPIDVLVPAAAMDPSLAVMPETPTPSALVSTPAAERSWYAALALFAACALIALRVARSSARTRPERSVEHALVPLAPSVRSGAVFGLGFVLALVDRFGSALAVGALALAVVALASSRRAPTSSPPKLGSFRHATPSIFRAARRATLVRAVGLDAWLDATTIPGLAVLTVFALVVLAGAPREALGASSIAVAIVVHAYLVDARASRPEPALVTLDRLVGLARRVRVSLDGPPIALLPVIHLGVGGEAHEARLRVVGALAADVLRTDVVPISRGLLGARFGLLVVARRGGPADEALARAVAFREVSVGSERVARVLPIRGAQIDEAFAALALVLAPTAAAPLASAPKTAAA